MMKSAMIKDLYSEIDRLKQGSSLHPVHLKNINILIQLNFEFEVVALLTHHNFLVKLRETHTIGLLKVICVIFFTLFNQRYMLLERKMESIYHEIVIFKMKLKRRFTSYHIVVDVFFPEFYMAVRILRIHIVLYTQAMSEKIERMELDSDSKDKVCFA